MPRNEHDQGEYTVAHDPISADYEEKRHDSEFATPDIFYLFDKRESVVVGTQSCSTCASVVFCRGWVVERASDCRLNIDESTSEAFQVR